MHSFFRKFRTFKWITAEFITKHRRILLVSLLLGLGSFLFVSKILPVLPTPKPTERIGLVGRFTLDRLPENVLNQSSQGLTMLLEDGSPAPALAEKWDVSKDGKTYTFLLKEDLIWQDGSPVIASELEFGLSDLEVIIPDDLTIEFHLKESFAPFPIILSRPVFKKDNIGIGLYQIMKIKRKGDFITQIFLEGPDKNLLYKTYPNSQTALIAFKLGEIDLLEDVFEMTLDSEWGDAVKVETNIRKDHYAGAFFNFNHPLLGDKKIRQALVYAVKKDFGQERAIGPLSPDSWAFNPEVKRYDYDPEKAKELFENDQEATESGETIEEEEMEIKISTTQTLLPVAEKIKQSWEEVLGIRVEIETVNILPQDFQVLLILQQIPQDPDQYSLWHSTQEQNFTDYQSPKVDKLLEDARKTMDQAKRKEKYLDFQKFLAEDVPAIFLYYPEVYTISR